MKSTNSVLKIVSAWRNFQKTSCGMPTYDKWNFVPQILSIFHFDQVSDVRMAHVLGVKNSYWYSISWDIFFMFSLKYASCHFNRLLNLCWILNCFFTFYFSVAIKIRSKRKKNHSYWAVKALSLKLRHPYSLKVFQNSKK